MRGKQKKLDNSFFFAIYLTRQASEANLASYATGTTVAGIGSKGTPIGANFLSNFSEQRRIGVVLGALDDKIELNRRMNETLEAMARAIFKDWFVDFGPTRAKMEGRAPYLAAESGPSSPTASTKTASRRGGIATR